jgi:hypothetical protein
MRKSLGLVLLLAANIILLAHVFIPHHHHKQAVCIESTHCEGDKASHNHAIPDRDHQHDGTSEFFNCILNQVITLPINPGKEISDCITYSGNFSFDCFILSGEIAKIPPNACYQSFIDKNILLADHSHYISSHLGLRAPPAV